MIHLVEELGRAWCRATVVRSGGPERVDATEPDPTFKPRPVGFTARLVLVEAEPLLWEGDDA